MFGFWLIILFIILPGALGAAIGYVIGAREGADPDLERRSTMIGGSAGAGIGLVVLVIVFIFQGF